MTTILKMNRNRQINLPAAFISVLNLGDGRYFKANVQGNKIILTPIDPIERVFSKEDLDTVEETFKKEKSLSKPVTQAWVKKSHS